MSAFHRDCAKMERGVQFRYENVYQSHNFIDDSAETQGNHGLLDCAARGNENGYSKIKGYL